VGAVVAFVALGVALSGQAVALPGKNGVKSDDIKNGQVKGADLAKNAVSSSTVKNDSLTGSDIKESTLGPVTTAQIAGHASTADHANVAGAADHALVADKANALPALTWVPLALTNNWKNYSPTTSRPAAYAVDAQGIVHFRGRIYFGVGTAFTMPAALSPSEDVYLVVDEVNAHTGRLAVAADGQVTIASDPDFANAGSSFTSLDGLTYAP